MLRRRVATGGPLLCRRFSPSSCSTATQIFDLASGLAAKEADAAPSTADADAAPSTSYAAAAAPEVASATATLVLRRIDAAFFTQASAHVSVPPRQ